MKLTVAIVILALLLIAAIPKCNESRKENKLYQKNQPKIQREKMTSFKNLKEFYEYFNWIYKGLAVASLGFFILLIGNSGLLSGNTNIENIFCIAILFLISSTLLATASGIVKHRQGVEKADKIKYSSIHEHTGILGILIFVYATASLIIGIAEINNIITPIETKDTIMEIVKRLGLTAIILTTPAAIFCLHAFRMHRDQNKEKAENIKKKSTEQTEN